MAVSPLPPGWAGTCKKRLFITRWDTDSIILTQRTLKCNQSVAATSVISLCDRVISVYQTQNSPPSKGLYAGNSFHRRCLYMHKCSHPLCHYIFLGFGRGRVSDTHWCWSRKSLLQIRCQNSHILNYWSSPYKPRHFCMECLHTHLCSLRRIRLQNQRGTDSRNSEIL